MPPPTVSVLVPTFRRTDELARCFGGIQAQTRPADEVVIVRHASDTETAGFLAASAGGPIPLRVRTVETPGQVAALNAGIESCTGEIIAITDDDAVPRPDWLARIVAHFAADGTVGAVGGRDWVFHKGVVDGSAQVRVGVIQWFGRVVGHHHHGVGPARDVDILKGVNMAFRRDAIAGLMFDESLHGPGAQPHNDMAFCLAVRRRGWNVRYDPAVAVDHYPATRPAGDVRESLEVTSDAAYNLTWVMHRHLPRGRFALFLLWNGLVGTPPAPGLLRLPAAIVHGRPHGTAHFLAARRAERAALRPCP